jgi:hypothetical protein
MPHLLWYRTSTYAVSPAKPLHICLPKAVTTIEANVSLKIWSFLKIEKSTTLDNFFQNAFLKTLSKRKENQYCPNRTSCIHCICHSCEHHKCKFRKIISSKLGKVNTCIDEDMSNLALLHVHTEVRMNRENIGKCIQVGKLVSYISHFDCL